MKLFNYIVMMLTMMLILEFVGFGTGLSPVLNKFGLSTDDGGDYKADIQQSDFFSQILGSKLGVLALLLASGVGAVIIGFFSKSYDPSLILLPLIIWIATAFAGTFWAIISFADAGWMRNVLITIMLPLGAGFLWSAVEFFRGVS